MTVTQAFGRRVKMMRDLLNMRQEKLAELAGLTTQTVSKVENGNGTVEIETAFAIACALGMQMNMLFPDYDAYDKYKKCFDDTKIDFVREVQEMRMAVVIEDCNAAEVDFLVDICSDIKNAFRKAKSNN